MSRGWIGVDWDSTLTTYSGWNGVGTYGTPIKPMWDRVINWLAQGIEVRIVTARAHPGRPEHIDEIEAIQAYCLRQIGFVLPVTCQKDYDMIELWDDRAVTVRKNTGECLTIGRE